LKKSRTKFFAFLLSGWNNCLSVHFADVSKVVLYVETSICLLLQVCIQSDDNDEDSESPLARRKTGRSKKRRVKDLSVCVNCLTVYSLTHLYM